MPPAEIVFDTGIGDTFNARIAGVVYQLIVFQWIFPFEAVLVGFLLACVPYVLVRRPAAQLSRVARGGAEAGADAGRCRWMPERGLLLIGNASPMNGR